MSTEIAMEIFPQQFEILLGVINPSPVLSAIWTLHAVSLYNDAEFDRNSHH